MLLYIVIFFLLVVALVFATKKEKLEICELGEQNSFVSTSTERILTFVILFFLAFITAFRADIIGNDTISYINKYNVIASNGIGSISSMEIGYQILCYLFAVVGFDAHSFITIVSFVLYLFVWLFIKKYSSNPLFSVVLFFSMFFSFFASGIRQSIALVMCLYAYQMIKDKRKRRAVLLILIASTIHTSALMAFVFFVPQIAPKSLSIVVPVTLILSTLAMLGVFNSLLPLVFERYQGHFESGRVGSGWLGVSFYVIRNLLFCAIAYHSYASRCLQKRLELCCFSFALFIVIFGFSMNLFTRASDYFTLPLIVEIPNAIREGKLKNKKMLTVVLSSVLMLFFVVVLIFRPEWNNIYPFELRIF